MQQTQSVLPFSELALRMIVVMPLPRTRPSAANGTRYSNWDFERVYNRVGAYSDGRCLQVAPMPLRLLCGWRE